MHATNGGRFHSCIQDGGRRAVANTDGQRAERRTPSQVRCAAPRPRCVPVSYNESLKNIALELFLAPRGLVTILLFFAIPSELSLGSQFQGVLLFVILISCIIMTLSLISYKNKISQLEHLEKEEESVVNDITEEEN